MVKREGKRIRLVRSMLSKQQSEGRSRRRQRELQKHPDPSGSITTPARLPSIAVSLSCWHGICSSVGITFAVYGEETGKERLIPFDIVPRIISAQEWQRISAGLRQAALP